MSEGAPYQGPIIDLSQRYSAPPGSLIRLTYVSRRDADATDDIMINVLLSSVVRNYLSGISGTLWVSSYHFVQVLEGGIGVIEPAYRRICTDARHGDVTCIDRLRVNARSFTRPLAWHRIQNEKWHVVGVPADLPDTSFDEACEILIGRGSITTTR